MMASVVAMHLNEWINANNASSPTLGVIFGFLSFDNGFMNFGPDNFFQMRTMTTRFLMNNTTPVTVETVRKQASNVMAMLGLLGSHQVSASVTSDTPAVGIVASTLALADASVGELAVLLYNSHDTDAPQPALSVEASLTFSNVSLAGPKAAYAVYLLNNDIGSAYAVWLAAGSPAFPSASVLQAMRASQSLQRLSDPVLFEPTSPPRIALTLQDPSVALVHLCSAATPAPAPVTAISQHVVSQTETLLFWPNSASRCLLHYTVSFVFAASGTVIPLGITDSIFTTWIDVHNGQRPVHDGSYAIVATDYFGRSSL